MTDKYNDLKKEMKEGSSKNDSRMQKLEDLEEESRKLKFKLQDEEAKNDKLHQQVSCKIIMSFVFIPTSFLYCYLIIN